MPQNKRGRGGGELSSLSEVSIILVNYKTPQMTRHCITLLRDQLDLTRTTLIVVDNDSQDASTHYLKRQTDISYLERKAVARETGFQAHGMGLDLAFQKVTTPYVLTIHTDTLIHDISLLRKLIDYMNQHPNVAVIGSNQQRYRKTSSYLWRKLKTLVTISKRLVLNGPQAALDKKVREHRLKSFFCLYRSNLIRQHDLRFYTPTQNPGYHLQHCILKQGFAAINWPRAEIFSCVDHVQSGTVIENAKSDQDCNVNKRRFVAYQGVNMPSQTK
jgi:hypothetical protein